MNYETATLDAATEALTIDSLNNGPVPDNVAFVAVSGTYGTAVLAFQGSIDGTNYQSLSAVRLDSQAVETTPTMTDDTARQWKVDVTGMQKFRVYMTSIVSGAVAAAVQTANVPGGVPVLLNYNQTLGNQAVTGTLTVTSTSATALAVGANGATNPVLSVNANTASVATGITVVGAAAAAGVAVTVISSGTNESMTLNAKGTGTVTINGVATGNVVSGAAFVGNSSIKSIHATGGVGYATGAGGTVTQATDKSTGVTLNKVVGQITMNNAELAAGAEVTFTVTNSTVAAADVVIVNHGSAGTAGSYLVGVGEIGAGSFKITVSNASAGNLSEAIVLNFAVIKGASA